MLECMSEHPSRYPRVSITRLDAEGNIVGPPTTADLGPLVSGPPEPPQEGIVTFPDNPHAYFYRHEAFPDGTYAQALIRMDAFGPAPQEPSQ